MRPLSAIAGLSLMFGLAMGGPVAADPAALNLDAAHLAIRGYDPVAYFAAGAPTPGREDITAEHEGAVYRFASTANRAAFLAGPARYLPAYGGFCAMGTALRRKVDGDPRQWRIVDGRLYLNFDAGVARHWATAIPQHIEAADGHWRDIREVPAGSLRPAE